MKKVNFPLLDNFKKLDWNKQKRIIMTVMGGTLIFILLVVALSFCSSGGGTEPEPENDDTEIEEVLDVYFITAHENSNINVRREPTRNSDRILSISAGDISIRLKYLGESRLVEDYYWHNVLLPDGRTGWVREDVVVVDERIIEDQMTDEDGD